MAQTQVRGSQILDASLTDLDMASANKDGTAATPSLRTLGTGAQQAAAGNHTHSFSQITGTIAQSQAAEVLALADLTDVTGVTGTGATVVLAAGPTITGLVAGSPSAPATQVPLSIDANPSQSAYLLQAGKNGNYAYFRIDKDGNITDIGGNPALIKSSNSKPWFPNGLIVNVLENVADGVSVFRLDNASFLFEFLAATPGSGGGAVVLVQGAASQVNDLQMWKDDGGNVLGAVGAAGLATHTLRSATTTPIDTVQILGRNSSSGTPGTGFGSSLLWQLQSSTTANRNAAEIDSLWATATDATRKGRLTLSAWDATAAQEGIRIESNGSSAFVGVGGAVDATAIFNVNGTCKATAFTGDGSALTNLNASNLATGTVALARGGTGANLSATGAGFLKQASAGAAVSVAPLAVADLPVTPYIGWYLN